MYTPKHYAVDDRPKMFEFMKSNNFGILFSHTGSEPMASHLPFMLNENDGEQGIILGHMAKANRQWRHADGQQVLVVFHGPHTYVSPTWYQEEDTVPTWNYVAVHATGVFKAVKDRARLEESVGRLTEQHEASQPQPWQPDFSTTYSEQMLKRIVAFEIKITSLQGKWKLNQNHPEHRRRRVAQQLKTLGGDANLQIAGLMDEDMAG
ncbi:MAG: FMN-binding negative transcriptional regulator [Chloroflexi bacterium]|nr:FMN-binding negative transcriptional regulator [Chloroflexota bacterium]MCI0812056.1 FMN-binding negative transcriptional regulator [Chloroflexota bacterium]MCI0830899.1 FMN-binding negative transcriptional regulator [Chloroflexota bacterium]MCI0862635.1 FMN-binding negative transcriptional regulator [Chloroflexota bacterium]MCI0896657.1 FMN-binding negative transcriptional regulator [Chloroflexota bacterium]